MTPRSLIRADSAPGAPAQAAAAGELVLRASRAVFDDVPGAAFLARRALAAAAGLPSGAARHALHALACEIALGAEPARASSLLVGHAALQEEAGQLAAAAEAAELALALNPADPEITLHAARIQRKLGRPEQALALYRRAGELADGAGLVRLARIGEALVMAEPEPALAGCIREALRAGDGEASGVAYEERARIRRARGDRRGAATDLARAALRYRDRRDRGRSAHLLADVLVAAGDVGGAREALLAALHAGDDAQRAHARVRLHGLARDCGDRVGQRRWRSSARPGLVSLGTGRRPAHGGAASAAGLLARWRGRLERRA
jgi:tetratricopeptide (TPR) repeat protein